MKNQNDIIEIPLLYFGPLPSINSKYTLSKYKFEKNGKNKRVMVLSPTFKKAEIELVKVIYPQLLHYAHLIGEDFKFVNKISINFTIQKITKNGYGTSMDIDNFLKPFIDITTKILGYDDRLVKRILVEGKDGITIGAAQDEFSKLVSKYGILDNKKAKRVVEVLSKKNHIDKILIGKGIMANKKSSRKKKHKNGSIKNSLPSEVFKLGIPLVHAFYMAKIDPQYSILVGSIRYDTPQLKSQIYRVETVLQLHIGDTKIA